MIRRNVLVTASLLVGCSSGAQSPPDASSPDTGRHATTDSGSHTHDAADTRRNGGDGGHRADSATLDDATSDSPSVGDSGPDGAHLSAPAPAAAVGYTVSTFDSTFVPSGVDTTNSGVAGFEWYLAHFFGGAPSPKSSLTFNADGSMTVSSGVNSAAPASSDAGVSWVGTAFGGGAYFEATLKFDPGNTIDASVANRGAWPAWWGEPIEHCVGLPGEQWTGQAAGYVHFVETDFFEYDVWSFSPHNEYGGATHDWYGIHGSASCPKFCSVSNAGGDGTSFSNFQVQTPTQTDFTQYHQYGYLWVPATSSTQGYAQYFFDRIATNDRITWSQYTGGESPPPGTAPWTFGALDAQHIVLLLSTGTGQPMTVKEVVVWQASGAKNLQQ